MARSTPAALLLSALVFPGAGHWYLKRFVTGSVFVSLGAVTTLFMINEALNVIQPLTDKIVQQPELATDLTSLLALVHEQVASSELSVATLSLACVWAVALIHLALTAKQTKANSIHQDSDQQ